MPQDEEEFREAGDWMADLRAQHYVNQVELSANGYDERILLVRREGYARKSLQQVSSSMKGTTAYDGACACGGLIEVDNGQKTNPPSRPVPSAEHPYPSNAESKNQTGFFGAQTCPRDATGALRIPAADTLDMGEVD